MGRIPEQTFVQRRHTEGQRVHEKRLSIANHQRNENQNDRYHLTPVSMAIITKITNIGEDVKKKEPFYTVGGNVNWCRHYGKQYGSSSGN